MQAERSDHRRAAAALTALVEMRIGLQQAHLAARELEALLVPARDAGPADRIHALRVTCARLAGEMEAALAEWRAADLRAET
jgi:hypothetical protein